MSNPTTVLDVRGLSCPQPAMLVRQMLVEIRQGAATVLVDPGTAQLNVTRVARENGWTVTALPQADAVQPELVK